MQSVTPRTPPPQSSMEMETLCFGAVCLLREQPAWLNYVE